MGHQFFSPSFCGPGTAVGLLYVFSCYLLNEETSALSASILVHLDHIYVKFKVIGENIPFLAKKMKEWNEIINLDNAKKKNLNCKL